MASSKSIQYNAQAVADCIHSESPSYWFRAVSAHVSKLEGDRAEITLMVGNECYLLTLTPADFHDDAPADYIEP